MDLLIQLAMTWFDMTHECAFVTALQLRSAGVTAAMAQAMFRAAEKKPLQ